ncbi:hypothetical protein CC86DRAFT_406090 [Ophiobolus disseminans]|uniref:Uncharacterized protein n=1 Tax=Ophiobolus disseminans TaxID=1469910 RepID=A0A6A7A167_9PLEO|nr:hypothetical protein CC86DRAFT_406090 [Ophiobolus disseminans]
MTHSFFVLPPELRLQVYAHATSGSMADGKITDIGGLLFSCREIYGEMNTGFVSKVRPILENMSKWIATHPDRTPVLIRFSPDYNFVHHPTKATISLPSRLSDDDEGTEYLQKYVPVASAAVLCDLFCLSWTVITIHLYFPNKSQDEEGRFIDMWKMYLNLFYRLAADFGYHGVSRHFADAETVVLRLRDGQKHSKDFDSRVHDLVNAVVFYMAQLLQPNGPLARKCRTSTTKSLVGRQMQWESRFHIAE